jgi:acetyltransferase-like isoleucine patch superfamily enzyme
MMKSHKLEHDWFPEALPDNVFLGERNWLYSSFAFRHYCSRQPVGLQTGHDTGLYNGTFFDLGPNGEVRIGNYCTLVGAIICSDRRIVIQDYVFIAHEVVLADSFAATPFTATPEDWKEDKVQTQQSSPVSILIGENAWIGARAVLLGGTRIGEGAIVGAYSVVCQDVPPYTIVAGNPARIIRKLNGVSIHHD